MLYTVGCNIVCIHINIPYVFSVGFLVDSMVHDICHKQCSLFQSSVCKEGKTQGSPNPKAYVHAFNFVTHP